MRRIFIRLIKAQLSRQVHLTESVQSMQNCRDSQPIHKHGAGARLRMPVGFQSESDAAKMLFQYSAGLRRNKFFYKQRYMEPMNFFRNPEIKLQLLLFLVISALFTVVGFLIGPAAGCTVLTAACTYGLLHFISTYRRYRRLAEMARQIDVILHGGSELQLSDYIEGELSVLQSEISKLMVRLREQTVALERDKGFLADALADISHQIRTPLTSMHLILSLMRQPDLNEERRIVHQKELSRLLARIDWLITALLKMSRLDAGTVRFTRDEIRVSALIEQAVAPLLIPMEIKRQSLDVSGQGDETFRGDLAWTAEALGNVLKNCMEHTPEGGTIHLTVLQNAIYTQLTVRDEGEGICEEDLPHLFDRFYKGRNAGRDSFGIGLALARMILMAQNGTIKAERPRGAGGAVFVLRFYRTETL